LFRIQIKNLPAITVMHEVMDEVYCTIIGAGVVGLGVGASQAGAGRAGRGDRTPTEAWWKRF